ncbi:transporter substrate-binding domain-containing protein [Pararhizobium mangrovi]|uniref:Transporter substrate-binding domain-containing protein n=2 Tax=Pararhizobium mangrovi TaxID=2590452 RepID=A0A506UCR0_9HYPH|nr:transporter substrate-binding domain-containing protein [Pararhizobium mangrovi]
MIVATRDAPPFAFQDANGNWEGISVELWKRIAERMNLTYRFQKTTKLSDMIDGVADGRFGASVAAMTITPEREAKIDFTHPFYTTGFGIAVHREGAGWFRIMLSIFSWQFLQAIAALAAVLLLVGLLTWLFERGRNRDEFGGPWWRGLASGFWFSAVTMTTVGYGDKAPRSIGGRFVALVWMFAAIIIISTFTGMIASAITTTRLSGLVQGPDDLARAKTGTVGDSASAGWLANQHIGFTRFDSVQAGLDALSNRDIDAFVYDKPLLRYRVNTDTKGAITVLPGTFGRQDYGIVLPQGSRLRERINENLLEIIQSGVWRDIQYRYLGNPVEQ